SCATKLGVGDVRNFIRCFSVTTRHIDGVRRKPLRLVTVGPREEKKALPHLREIG
ncbi:hypothetical protein BaRGS_00032554, partial [Batillaria attramentaria]